MMRLTFLLASLLIIMPMTAFAQKADAIIVLKSERRMMLMKDGATLREYSIALGFSPQGHKGREGDGKTPEGRYRIDFKNARSGYHRALRVSYPNADDRKAAAARGEDPGGDIMIHGLKNGMGWLGGLHRLRDWTYGCIAVTNAEIEEIWSMVDVGTPIEIKP